MVIKKLFLYESLYSMKKIAGLILSMICLTACNDGDLVFEDLNFNENQEIQKCKDNELYFKINNNELLLVDFTFGTNGSVLDTLATLGEIKTLKTSNQPKIYYRTYDGALNTNTICSLVPPANPKVVSEYTSVAGGTINYTRTMVPVVTESAVNVTYMYTINFENITLTNGSSEIRYTTLPYGSYIYDSSKLSFNFGTNFAICDHILTGKISNEMLQLQLPQDFIFPTTNQTQIIALNNTNLLSYFTFKTTISNTDICDFPDDTPLKEEWYVNNGNLEIVSEAVINKVTGEVTGYKHVLKLIDAEFMKDKSSFKLTDRILGTYQVVL